jgi:hypothetical protein
VASSPNPWTSPLAKPFGSPNQRGALASGASRPTRSSVFRGFPLAEELFLLTSPPETQSGLVLAACVPLLIHCVLAKNSFSRGKHTRLRVQFRRPLFVSQKAQNWPICRTDQKFNRQTDQTDDSLLDRAQSID